MDFHKLTLKKLKGILNEYNKLVKKPIYKKVARLKKKEVVAIIKDDYAISKEDKDTHDIFKFDRITDTPIKHNYQIINKKTKRLERQSGIKKIPVSRLKKVLTDYNKKIRKRIYKRISNMRKADVKAKRKKGNKRYKKNYKGNYKARAKKGNY